MLQSYQDYVVLLNSYIMLKNLLTCKQVYLVSLFSEHSVEFISRMCNQWIDSYDMYW